MLVILRIVSEIPHNFVYSTVFYLTKPRFNRSHVTTVNDIRRKKFH